MIAWTVLLLCAPLVGWGIERLARGLAGVEPNGLICVGGAAVAAVAALLTPEAPLAESLTLAWTLLALAIIDVMCLRLPDLLTLPLMIVGLGLALVFDGGAMNRAIGAAAAYIALSTVGFAYLRLRGRHGLGLGDAKLLAAGGAWLGWRPLPAVVLLACAGGLAWIAARFLRDGRVALQAPLPFGAPLCLAIWVAWMTHLSAS